MRDKFAANNFPLEIDVASSASVAAALNEIVNKYKRPPAVIVNSAGITRDKYLLKMPEADFDAVINVNLKVGTRRFMVGVALCATVNAFIVTSQSILLFTVHKVYLICPYPKCSVSLWHIMSFLIQ